MGKGNDVQTRIKRAILVGDKDVMVMTTIGITPQQFWYDPVDLGYDVRVPDLWSDYVSMKNFFLKNKYEKVHSYLNYGPYIEMLKMLVSQGIVKEVIFYSDPTLSNRRGNLGAFFSIKQGDKEFEQQKYTWELKSDEEMINVKKEGE